MDESISRRSFMKRGAALGAATVVGGKLLENVVNEVIAAAPQPAAIDLAVVAGKDWFASTVRAVELLGEMKRFVTKNARVAILPNTFGRYPGASVKPEIILAIAKMCMEAEAAEVCNLREVPRGYWTRVMEDKRLSVYLDGMTYSRGRYTTVPIPKGKILKTADVLNEILEYDVLINLPISKHHDGTGFTGALKNMMGISAYEPTNRFMHYGDGSKGGYDNIPFLSQTIADLNLIRKPTLCLCDSTEFLTSNGPMGPGDIGVAGKIVAGTEPASLDAYCCRFLNLTPDKVTMIGRANEHGLGEIDCSKLEIKEVAI